jgi:HSP20 family protein
VHHQAPRIAGLDAAMARAPCSREEGTMANITRKQQQQPQQQEGEQGRLARRSPFSRMSDLLRWDPFGDMASLGLAQFPNIEVKETKDAFVFKADLPGVNDEDLDIQVHSNRLTIGGERREEERTEDDRFYTYERSYGSFSRSFTLPEGADLDSVKADLKNGVLTVLVPKKAEVQPKKISVGGKGAQPREIGEQPTEKDKDKEKAA